jgi:hypothetical protein
MKIYFYQTEHIVLSIALNYKMLVGGMFFGSKLSHPGMKEGRILFNEGEKIKSNHPQKNTETD